MTYTPAQMGGSPQEVPSRPLTYLDAAALRACVSYQEAVSALRAALRDGLVDVEAAPARTSTPLSRGEVLCMPAEVGDHAGVKVVTRAPGNRAQGRPTIQGLYVLFDAEHLGPVAVVDAAELTLLRTAATTTLAISEILRARPDLPSGHIGRLALIGTGPQARSHAHSLAANLDVAEIVVLGRRAAHTDALVDGLKREGLPVSAGTGSDLGRSDVVVCVTSSSTPVFEDVSITSDAVVAAIGAHGLGKREVPPEFVLRADIVVESVANAMRESGDLIPARSEAEWRTIGLVNMRDLVAGSFVPTPGRPTLFTGVGMGWQDAVVVSRALRA